MKLVYMANDLMTAHFVRSLLDAEGVAAVISGEALSFYSGKLPADGMGPTVSVVRDEEYDRARGIVAAFERGERPMEEGDPWACPACGEELPGQFTQCWKCGAARPDPDGTEP